MNTGTASAKAPNTATASEVRVVHPPVANIRTEIEKAVTSTNGGRKPCWEEYQSSIALAGRFCAAAMQMTEIRGGKIDQAGSAEIDQREALLVKNLKAALPIMQEVADRTFNSAWHCARGHTESNAELLGAAEIAVQFGQAGREITDVKALTEKVVASYRYAASKIRVEGVAEEHWGCLVAAAAIGSREYILENTTK